MEQLQRPLFTILAGILIGLLLAGGLWLVARSPQGQPVALRPPPTPEPIVVHVIGAVARPGVYNLPTGSRVQDAVRAAGGLLAEADKEAINLAARLEDGEQLEVPYLPGMEPVGTPSSSFQVIPGDSGAPSSSLININTATLEELDTLPGIGPTTAQKIIDYREQHGPFARIEDIMNVSGIGPATFERIQDLITVE